MDNIYVSQVHWGNGVAKVQGNPRKFKLDTSQMVKTTNYSRDDRVSVDVPGVGLIANPMYDPGRLILILDI